MPDVDYGISRTPKHITDGIVRDKIRVIQAALATALADVTAVKTSVDASKTGGVGLTDGETATLQTLTDTAVTSNAAVATAIDDSGL